MKDDARFASQERLKVVVTVHGIRTFGQWQERLGSLLVAANPNVSVEHYHYGYFSVIAFLIPPLRWLVTLRFRRHVREISARFPGAEISFVAHSFGTHLVGYGLYGMRPTDNINVATVLLAGSVLRTSFPWGELINSSRVRRVINDCGIDDNILLLSQFCVLFTGMAGRLGFRGMTGKSIINRYFVGGHSHYFESKGEGDSEFMERYWVPVLAHDSPLVSHDERTVKGPLQGVILTLIQIADPIKLLAYFGIVGSLVIYFYWIPKIETRESFSRAVQSDLGRATALARTYYETLNDSPRAIASLVSNLPLSGKAEVDVSAQRRILKYWLQSVRPIEDVLNDIEEGAIVRWSKNYYAAKKGAIKFLTQAEVLAGVRLSGSDQVFLICSDNVARVVSLSSLTIVKEIKIPPPSESMGYQWGSAKFDSAEFQRNIFSLLTAKDDSEEETLGDEDDTEEDVAKKDTPEETVSEMLARYNDPALQTKDVEVLDLKTLSYDPSSSLVVGVGWQRSHSGSRSQIMQAFDPSEGTIAAIEYSTYGDLDKSRGRCGYFRVYDFWAGTDHLDLRVRLRKPGDNNFFNYFVVGHEEGGAKLRADDCGEKIISEGLISSLKFPSVISERDLWRSVSNDDAPELIGDEDDEQYYRAGGVDTEPVVGEWHYSGLVEHDNPEGRVRLYSEFGFEDRPAAEVPWDKSVRWVSMSDGMKYGIYHICRFHLGVAVSCAYVRCMGNFCHEDLSEEGNLMAVSSYKEFGNNSLYVLSLASMQFIDLPETPDGGIDSVIFDERGVLSVLTNQYEIWLYSNLTGTPVSQSMLLVPPGSDYSSDSLYSIPMIGDDPVAVYADGGLGRIGRFTMTPTWISTRLLGTGRVNVQVPKEGGFLIVHNDTYMVLLDAETGISISRPLKVKDFISKDERGWGAEGIVIGVAQNGSVVVKIDDSVFVRAAALSDIDLEERLQRIVQYIGFDHSANSVAALPVTK